MRYVLTIDIFYIKWTFGQRSDRTARKWVSTLDRPFIGVEKKTSRIPTGQRAPRWPTVNIQYGGSWLNRLSYTPVHYLQASTLLTPEHLWTEMHWCMLPAHTCSQPHSGYLHTRAHSSQWLTAATVWVLGIKPRAFIRKARALNCLATSPGPLCLVLQSN